MFERRLLAAAVCLALPGLADADEVVKLPDVTVKATQPEDSTALPATTLDAAEVRAKRARTSDTASLLKGVPGVSLYGAGGLSSLPAIHGLADDRLRIRVDGMDLMAACPNHMNPPLSYLDPSQVGVLKVWAGITPVSVGGDSIGGTIVAETPAPEFVAPGQPALIKGQAGTFYRSNGDGTGVNLSATFAGDRFSVTYIGSMAQSNNTVAGGDFKPTTATGRPGHTLPLDEIGSTAYKAWNHALNLAFRNGEDLFEAKLGLQRMPYQLYPNQRMDMLDNDAERVNLRYLGQFGWGTLEARVYHESVDHHMDFGADKQFQYGFAPGMPMDTESRNTGARLMASVDLGPRGAARVGGELQHYRLDDWWPPSPAVLPPGVAFGGMAPNTFWNLRDGERDRTALFGEWESQLNAQWLTLVGARYERVKTDAGPVQGYNDVMAGYAVSAAEFNARDHSRTDDNVDFTALARYTPTPNHTVEFGFARKVRSPNLYERYAWSKHSMALEMVNFVGDGNGYLGDVDLKPEQAHTLSATLDWHAADRTWELKATPYFTRVIDYIDARRCIGSGTMMNALCGGAANNTAVNRFVHLQYVNQSARIYGIDLSGSMPLARTAAGALGLKGLINYTRGENRDTGDDLYNIMPLNATITLTHKLGGWDSGLEIEGVKGKHDVSDVRNEVRTPGYALVHLRASYSWKRLRLDFGVDNLFDRLYYLPTGGAYVGQGATMSFNREVGVIGPNGGTASLWGIAVPGMGRSVYAGLTLDF